MFHGCALQIPPLPNGVSCLSHHNDDMLESDYWSEEFQQTVLEHLYPEDLKGLHGLSPACIMDSAQKIVVGTAPLTPLLKAPRPMQVISPLALLCGKHVDQTESSPHLRLPMPGVAPCHTPTLLEAPCGLADVTSLELSEDVFLNKYMTPLIKSIKDNTERPFDFMFIEGGPGTGKTHFLISLWKMLQSTVGDEAAQLFSLRASVAQLSGGKTLANGFDCIFMSEAFCGRSTT
jgi:hypothetical protein